MVRGTFEMNLKILTLEQLRQLEERLHDLEVDGIDVVSSYDQVIFELERRGEKENDRR